MQSLGSPRAPGAKGERAARIGQSEVSSFDVLYNIAVAATNRGDSQAALLRAYLDAVTLSEALQTQIWHAAELTLVQVRVMRRLAKQEQAAGHEPW